jgi:beta-mannosidase
MRRVRSLSGSSWTVRAIGCEGEIPFHYRQLVLSSVAATIPGCVHTDLLRAHVIEDPYLEDHELSLRWIGNCDWIYETTLSLSEADIADAEQLDLVFEGLDTLAEIRLNGGAIGRSSNMHVAVRIDIKSVAKVGENLLAVQFASPRKYIAEAYRREPIPHVGGVPEGFHPHNQLRKMACNFGWDWGPDVATCGIWRPVSIESWSSARINAVRPLITEASSERATVQVHVDLDHRGARQEDVVVDACLISPEAATFSPIRQHAHVSTFAIDKPHLWWPVGHGAQPLYLLRVCLKSPSGEVLDIWERKIGLKTSRLLMNEDESPDGFTGKSGSQFSLCVNGKPIFLKGANWIPADCFPHRVTAERYEHLLSLARDANFNTIRVWGGGIYESDTFYDICDRLGLIVWQDFLFACSMYPEHGEYRAEVEREARYNIARLAHHPSLSMYNGGNECIEAGLEWSEDFPAYRASGKPWGLFYWLDLLPRLVNELDPTRPYWPNSPYSGSMDIPTNSNEHGTRHIWDVWNGGGTYRNYLAHAPRMATEFGYHGPASYSTIARAVPPEQRYWNSPLMLLHNKNQRNGQQQTTDRMADDMIPQTQDYDRWHYLAQAMQARALTMGVEWFRALHPWNSGAIFWQFNDCYPVSSWSAVDSDGRAKPLLHAAKKFFAPRMLTIMPSQVYSKGQSPTSLAIHLHNDTDQPWTTVVLVRRLDLQCQSSGQFQCELSVPARSLSRVIVPQRLCADGAEFLHARAESGESSCWWIRRDKEMSYPIAKYTGTLVKMDDGYELSVHAHTILRDVVIQVDRLDPSATISNSFVTLLAGESAKFTIATQHQMSSEKLLSPPVFQCVNGVQGSAQPKTTVRVIRLPEVPLGARR